MDCDCKVSGYFEPASVVVSEIVYCSTHAKAFEYKVALEAENARLREALLRSAKYGHRLGGYHSPRFTKFENCNKVECIAARAALAQEGSSSHE